MVDGTIVTDNNFTVCYFQSAICAFDHVKALKKRWFHEIDSHSSASHVPLNDGLLWQNPCK